MNSNLPLLRPMVENRITALGAGPMSKHSIDAIIELANSYRKYIFMIPSRRQIDALALGGGYVENFSTEDFVKYVRDGDSNGFVKLARDHSGPWQLSTLGADGKTMDHGQAMKEVKSSLEVDIECGFDLIHIDPSPGLEQGLSQDQVNDDALELLDFCQSKDLGRIEYEVGADEQSMMPSPVSSSETEFKSLMESIDREGLRRPIFFVLQTGTKVKETRNVGAFDRRIPTQGAVPAAAQVPRMIQMCERNGVLLKEHNADYLSDTALLWHRRFGIHAANVAPEFGVVETRALLGIAQRLDFTPFIEALANVSLSSRKWEKWLVEDSSASDIDKIEISGHYHFNDPLVLEERLKMMRALDSKLGLDGEAVVYSAVREAIDRYLRLFGYGENC